MFIKNYLRRKKKSTIIFGQTFKNCFGGLGIFYEKLKSAVSVSSFVYKRFNKISNKFGFHITLEIRCSFVKKRYFSYLAL